MKIILNQDRINGEVRQYLWKLDSFTEEQLCKIYSTLNSHEWPKLLGEKPKDWDLLANSTRTLSEFIWKHTRTRSRILRPIMIAIERRIGNKKLLEWHWVNNLGITKEEGHQWYKERLSMRDI